MCSRASPTESGFSGPPKRLPESPPEGRPTPATRLLAAVTAALLGVAWGGWVAAAVVLLTALLALGAGRLRGLTAVLAALLPVALSSLAVNAFLPAGAGALATAAGALLRLLALTLPLSLLFLLTPLADLLDDLEWRGLGRRPAFVLGAALAAVPRARDRAEGVIDAQRARGLDTEGSWRRRLRGLLPLVAPLVIGSLAEVEERALALEVRGFQVPGRRTVLRPPSDARGEAAARWALALLLVAGLAARAALR